MGRTKSTPHPSLLLPTLYSLAILGLGLWVSLASGQWIAMVCAAGLMVLPARTWSARRAGQAPHP